MGDRERAFERAFRKLSPLYDHIDLTVESASDGVFRCSVPLEERNSNHAQTMHAAIQWAAAEALGGVAFAAMGLDLRKYLGVVKSAHIDFKRPATTRITAETSFPEARVEAVKAELEEQGRCDFELDVVVRGESGKTVAEAHCVYAIRPQRAAP